MLDSLKYIFESGDIWAIILKVLITALVTGLASLTYTLIGKAVAKSKTSKLRYHAKIAVESAEQKFPNEGTKMGPQKMAYVMDYLAITFPKIKNNQYLYNIAEAAVLELNREKEEEAARKEFEEKYGEDPLKIQDQINDNDINEETSNKIEEKDNLQNDVENASNQKSNEVNNKLNSF